MSKLKCKAPIRTDSRARFSFCGYFMKYISPVGEIGYLNMYESCQHSVLTFELTVII